MLEWVIRNSTWLMVMAVAFTIAAIGIAATFEPTPEAAFIAARQMYGLTALGVLLGACIIGPLTAVFPRMPLRRILMANRRSIGVSACIFVVPHIVCYLWPMFSLGWRELFNHGNLWVVGLSLGFLPFVNLSILAWTSRDASVKSLGGRRWKQLHRTVYAIVPVVLLHAVLVGADFGFATQSKGEPDYGSLVIFSIFTSVWVMLFGLRYRGVQWPTRSRIQSKQI